ncbi:Na(+)-translocating NADH-quinone reductase subunit C [Thioalkalivibrio sp. XN279]|uniref:Na(+)-translocating NADH-quinone reductase subunit C n=1 Tax=Thioalkalivibrio sp. XN279 TaxID=2714953 RepID=UPI0014079E32|nr:Na(+)-translocating NADH-quinone reductase subunit C [Thioalkalivibrio sp. XN279]NHA15972.1 Na(+)-translocating NADH-quinone reductase subunit C [Thioalkalivibrio sp. XN279]
MSESNAKAPTGLFGRLLALPNDSVAKMLLVTIVLSLVCSVLVSSAAVLLKPMQERNVELARKARILEVAGLMEPGRSVEALFEGVETRLVELETGEFSDALDPQAFDQQVAARDPELGVAIPPWEDIAGISRRARYAPVYLVRDDAGALDMVILPVHGYGLWSTMYGFLALSGDGRTVRGLTFYQHAETPGLGGEIENPRWLARWEGRRVFGPEGEVRLQVVHGTVDPGSEWAEWSVDGLSGATLTADGVSNMVQYWLGEQGFGPFLTRLREEGI